MKLIDRTISRVSERCPNCGCSLIVLARYDNESYRVFCRNCHAGPDYVKSDHKLKQQWANFVMKQETNNA